MNQLKAYQAGGEGYITKPIMPDKLHAAVKERLKIRNEYKRLEDEAQHAMKTALEAMTNNSELGQIIRFVDRLNSVENFEELGGMVLQDCNGFGLVCCIQIRSTTKNINMGNGSFDAKLLTKSKGQDRFLHYGRRTFVNYPGISILIKNMPVDDDSTYGRYKDGLAFIANATSNRVRSIELEQAIKEERDEGLKEAVVFAEADLKEISSDSRKITDKVSQMLVQMREEMEDYLFSLGLTDDQESAIMSVFDHSVEELARFNHKYQLIDERFSNILDRFSKLSVG